MLHPFYLLISRLGQSEIHIDRTVIRGSVYVLTADDAMHIEVNTVQSEDVVDAQTCAGCGTVGEAGLPTGHATCACRLLCILKACIDQVCIGLTLTVEVVVTRDHDRDIAVGLYDAVLDLQHVRYIL